MTCDDVQPNLVAYHAGISEPVERDGIDGHLLGCRGCLQRYLEAKRASEDVPFVAALPSTQLRARLRDEVRQLAPGPVAVVSHRWRRTWLMSAAVAALVLLAFALSHHAASPPASSPLIDSDQAEASLSVL